MPATVEAPVTRSPWEAWFRIMRPGNLAMIIGAMLLFYRRANVDGFTTLGLCAIGVMVALAAGGNMINDYFDIREDAVNKPRLALVGRVIKRRVVLVSHWIWMLVALFAAVVISLGVGASWPLIWTLVLGICLTIYSPWAKRRFLIGNLLVAGSVAQLPMWALLVSQGGADWAQPLAPWFAVTAAGFALTLLREVVKDVQDAPGDSQMGFDTLPIRWGSERTWTFLRWGYTAVGAGLTALSIAQGQWAAAIYLLPLALAYRAVWRSDARALSAWTKVVLGCGLLAFGWS